MQNTSRAPESMRRQQPTLNNLKNNINRRPHRTSQGKSSQRFPRFPTKQDYSTQQKPPIISNNAQRCQNCPPKAISRQST